MSSVERIIQAVTSEEVLSVKIVLVDPPTYRDRLFGDRDFSALDTQLNRGLQIMDTQLV
jgi:hypothetical protein